MKQRRQKVWKIINWTQKDIMWKKQLGTLFEFKIFFCFWVRIIYQCGSSVEIFFSSLQKLWVICLGKWMEITVCNIPVFKNIAIWRHPWNMYIICFLIQNRHFLTRKGEAYIYIYICIPDIFFNMQCFWNQMYILYMKPRRTKNKWNWLCVVYTLQSAKTFEKLVSMLKQLFSF